MHPHATCTISQVQPQASTTTSWEVATWCHFQIGKFNYMSATCTSPCVCLTNFIQRSTSNPKCHVTFSKTKIDVNWHLHILPNMSTHCHTPSGTCHFNFQSANRRVIFFFTSHTTCQNLNRVCQLTCNLLLCRFLRVKCQKVAKTLSKKHNSTIIPFQTSMHVLAILMVHTWSNKWCIVNTLKTWSPISWVISWASNLYI